MLNFCSSLLLSVVYIISLVAVDTTLSFGAICFVGSIYIFVVSLVRVRLSVNSKQTGQFSTNQIKILRDTESSLKNIIIYGLEDKYIYEYTRNDSPLWYITANNQLLSVFPRYIAELAGIALIIGVAVMSLFSGASASLLISKLVAFGFAIQKVIPLLQQIYTSYAAIKVYEDDVCQVISSLSDLPSLRPMKYFSSKPTDFSFEKISLRGVSYCYPNSDKMSLHNLSLTINSGDKVGITGPTGGGKSTLIDIFLGLLLPSAGSILIDGKDLHKFDSLLQNWHRSIAFVPQEVTLSAGSFYENIAFGCDVIDYDYAKECAKFAQIYEFIDSLPSGFDSQILSHGRTLSGGQVQRIGIARALYRRPTFLILDEATSALDVNTEQKVMSNIYNYNPNLTILIIAHRLETLNGCGQVLQLECGNILQ